MHQLMWKTVSSFRDIEKYLPLVKSSVTEGSGFGAKRTCTVGTPDGKEAKINEEITNFDENTTYVYAYKKNLHTTP